MVDRQDSPAQGALTRRRLLERGAAGLGSAVVLGSGLAACGSDDKSSSSSSSAGTTTASSSKPKKAMKLTVAYTATAFPSILNNRAGLLYFGKDYGLDVSKDSLKTFNDSATATQALLSGQADVVSGSFLNDLLIVQKGTPLKALVSVSNGNDLLMLGRNGITDIKQVTSDKAIVATDSPGGLINLIYNAMFLANGIKENVEKLPHAKPYGDSPPRTASFISGQTNVTIVHKSDMPMVEKQVKDVKILSTLWEDVHGMIFEVIAATEDWISGHPDEATAVVSAVLKGNRELAKDFELYKKAAADFIEGAALKDSDLRPIWELARKYEFWPYNGGIDDSAVRFTQNVGKQSGVLSKTVEPAEAVDKGPLDAAIKSLGRVTVDDITSS